MSCTNHHPASAIVIPLPNRIGLGRPRFIAAIAAIVAALKEAWEMRCAIRKQYPFSDE
jgi:hypothetical protein